MATGSDSLRLLVAGKRLQAMSTRSATSTWLLDLTADALASSTDLSEFSGRVSESGEGRWGRRRRRCRRLGHWLNAALYERFASRGEADVADQLLSAMRKQFGGHAEIAATAG